MKIIDDLVELAVDVDDVRLVPLERNPRGHDQDAITASLRRFGQRKPIVVNERVPEIEAGHGTLTGARELNAERVAAVFVDEDKMEGRAYALADNRTHDLGHNVLDDLDYHATALLEHDESLAAAASFYESDLESLRFEIVRRADEAMGQLDPNDEWGGMPSFDQDDLRAAATVTVHFPTDADAVRFFELIDRPRERSLWWPHDDGHTTTDRHVAHVADDDTQDDAAD